jgi:hypothetical protein
MNLGSVESKCKHDWHLILDRVRNVMQRIYAEGFCPEDFSYVSPFVSMYILPYKVLANIGDVYTEAFCEVMMNLGLDIGCHPNYPSIASYLAFLDMALVNSIIAYVKTHPNNPKRNLDKFAANLVKVSFRDIEMMEDPVSFFYIRHWMAAAKIQRAWRRCIANPRYNICKKRLLIEFKVLSQV